MVTAKHFGVVGAQFWAEVAPDGGAYELGELGGEGRVHGGEEEVPWVDGAGVVTG